MTKTVPTQDVQRNLENLLDGLKTDVESAKKIGEESNRKGEKYLRESLTQSRSDDFSTAISKYMTEMDYQMELFSDHLESKILKLNSDFLAVHSIDRELKIKFLGEGAEGEGEDLLTLAERVARYIPDDELTFHKANLSPIKEHVGEIDSIKETYNRSFYLNDMGQEEFRGSSRVKKHSTEKFLRVIFEGSDFPTDFGGYRLIFQKSDHLYIVRHMLYTMDEVIIIEDDPRNMPSLLGRGGIPRSTPSRSNRGEIRRNIERAEELSYKTRDLTDKEIEQMKVGIWVDFSFNNMPMEVQFRTDRSDSVMETDSRLKHSVYINSRRVPYQGIKKMVKDFLDEASEVLRTDIDYKKQREANYQS